MEHIYHSKNFHDAACLIDTHRSLPVTYITSTNTWDLSPVIDWINGFKNNTIHQYTIVNAATVAVEQIDPEAILVFGWEMMNACMLYNSYSKRDKFINQIITVHRGPVVVIKQDEHLYNPVLVDFVKRIEGKLSAILTCTSSDKDAERVYGGVDTKYIHILPGYLPAVDTSKSKDFKDRSIDVLSRGRWLKPKYGELGRLKASIGEEMLLYWNRNPEVQHLNINHSNDARDRIYGAWIPTVKEAKTLLATPTGCNVIHSTRSQLDIMRDGTTYSSYQRVYAAEINNCRTALILYEGIYGDGVSNLVPGKHYIELKRDNSNIAEVWEKVQDLDLIERITNRAFKYATTTYAYDRFVRFIDCIYSGL